ncbi:MAG: hypothetical protein KAV41_01400 [Candidatus Pacebacteria bacterium]|nr:hypothetical protein [Candidatus Paceibacterota bacterium]
MNNLIKSYAKIFSLVLVLSATLGYAYYQTRDYIQGPILELISPLNGSTQHSGSIVISGRAKNISHISLNDRQIFTDQAGNFNEKILLSEGYNLIKISTRDKYQRENQKLLELIYTPIPQKILLTNKNKI